MLDVLHIGSLASYNGGIGALTRAIEGLAGPVELEDGTSDRIALDSANQLFGDGSTTWGRAFLTVLAKEYGAGMRTVDFRHAAEEARTLVNTWTAERTHDRIPHDPAGRCGRRGDPSGARERLVLQGSVALALRQAVDAARSLPPGRPHHGDRRPDAQRCGRQRRLVPGAHFVGARLLYAGNTLAMTVALPDGGHESVALAELLTRLTHRGDPGGVEISMPRWTFRTPTDLKAPLQ